MIIVNSPNNPTGDIFFEKVLKNLADFAKKHDLLILSDDVYDRLVFDTSIFFTNQISHISKFAPERTIACNSVSKSLCLTGVRIGWILGEKNLISEIAKVHRNINSCPATPFQYAIAKYLPESEKYFEEYKKSFKQKADKISKIFDACEAEYILPKGGMYIWVKKSSHYPEMDSEEFVYALIEYAGLSGVPGQMFGAENSDYVRFCFGALSDEDIEIFGERIEKMYVM